MIDIALSYLKGNKMKDKLLSFLFDWHNDYPHIDDNPFCFKNLTRNQKLRALIIINMFLVIIAIILQINILIK